MLGRPPIALIHLPRTAGTSLGLAVEESFGSGAFRLKQQGQVTAEVARSIPATAEVIYGHMNYGLHLHMPVRYATLLRDPIERYVSHYNLFRKQKARDDRSPSNFAFFLTRSKAVNTQTRMLSGTHSMVSGSSYDLTLAKQHLEQFAYVGFYDQLDAFATAIGVVQPVPHVNRSTGDTELDPEAIEAMRASNLMDIELYEWARERFAGTSPAGLDGPLRTVRRGDVTPPEREPKPLAVMLFPGASPGLNAAIVSALGKRAFPLNVRDEVPAAVLEMLPRELELFFGVMNYGMHHHWPVRYAAVLREPVERALVHWRTVFDKRARSGRTVDFDAARLEADMRNPMTRRLAAVDLNAVEARSDLDLAKRRLASFAVVGFHSDLAHFAETIGVDVPAPEAAATIDLTPEQLAAVRDDNALDRELFDWARDRFGALQSPAAV